MVGLGLAIALGGLLIRELPEKVDLQSGPGESRPAQPAPGLPAKGGAETPKSGETETLSAAENPVAHAHSAREVEIAQRFQQATGMLHMRQYDYAIAALHRVLELAPEMPEAHVNMGFALLGLEQYQAALDFFEGATVLRPEQANAYYGMAVALESMGRLRPAIEAMTTYLHLEKGDTEYTRKANAALWEWKSQAGIGRWGETRGVPPGYSAEDLQRDPEAIKQQILVSPSQGEGPSRSEAVDSGAGAQPGG